MASVSALDQDLRKLRLDKFTPTAANEARSWIEDILGEKLPSSDLLEGLKDGVALCKLANLATGPPGVKFKQSTMPFVQMENISHFLRACQSPPLNLQEHDMFLTVDLYERKDPAQVLQCLNSFSRVAHNINPSVFPATMDPRTKGGNVLLPENTGASPLRTRGLSTTSNTSSFYGRGVPLKADRTGDSTSGRWSPTKSPTGSRPIRSPGVSSWSNKEHEGVTSPAWNIAQYGYMGGASQGNLGIAFGGRRQITSAAPSVPRPAEKELRFAAERHRLQIEEDTRNRPPQLDSQEAQQRSLEGREQEDEARRLREAEKREREEEKRRWHEEERMWKLTEEKRRQEEDKAEARLAEERRQSRSQSNTGPREQCPGQNEIEKLTVPEISGGAYGDRVVELERQLELARQREREYEEERQRRNHRLEPGSRAQATSRPKLLSRPPSRQDSWSVKDDLKERELLRAQRSSPPVPPVSAPVQSPLPLPRPLPQPVKTNRTGEPAPTHHAVETKALPSPLFSSNAAPSVAVAAKGRPLPVPKPASPAISRTDRLLSSDSPPLATAASPPPQHSSQQRGVTAQLAEQDRRRQQPPQNIKAGGLASQSLLEREMEMERQRQKEWEQNQIETAKTTRTNDGVNGIGGGVGGRWDVSQWSGYTGGDSQNKGSQGIGTGRRQIVGPRPLPGRP